MKQVFINLFLCILFSFIVKKAYAEAKHDLMVFKTPTCGCCQLWIDHVELNGFNTQIRDQQSLENIKNILMWKFLYVFKIFKFIVLIFIITIKDLLVILAFSKIVGIDFFLRFNIMFGQISESTNAASDGFQ